MRYVFDIDDTILYSEWDEVKQSYRLMRHNADMVLKINHLYDKGHTIILHTGRHWNHLNTTLYQLSGTGLKYHSLVMGKPVADYYIDDKNLRPDEFMEMEV